MCPGIFPSQHPDDIPVNIDEGQVIAPGCAEHIGIRSQVLLDFFYIIHLVLDHIADCPVMLHHLLRHADAVFLLGFLGDLFIILHSQLIFLHGSQAFQLNQLPFLVGIAAECLLTIRKQLCIAVLLFQKPAQLSQHLKVKLLIFPVCRCYPLIRDHQRKKFSFIDPACLLQKLYLLQRILFFQCCHDLLLEHLYIKLHIYMLRCPHVYAAFGGNILAIGKTGCHQAFSQPEDHGTQGIGRLLYVAVPVELLQQPGSPDALSAAVDEKHQKVQHLTAETLSQKKRLSLIGHAESSKHLYVNDIRIILKVLSGYFFPFCFCYFPHF